MSNRRADFFRGKGYKSEARGQWIKRATLNGVDLSIWIVWDLWEIFGVQAFVIDSNGHWVGSSVQLTDPAEVLARFDEVEAQLVQPYADKALADLADVQADLLDRLGETVDNPVLP